MQSLDVDLHAQNPMFRTKVVDDFATPVTIWGSMSAISTAMAATVAAVNLDRAGCSANITRSHSRHLESPSTDL